MEAKQKDSSKFSAIRYSAVFIGLCFIGGGVFAKITVLCLPSFDIFEEP